MDWEKACAEVCIQALQPSGDVLEVGFGSGCLAMRIQMHRPSSHTIIEPNPETAKKARAFAANFSNVRVIEEPWQKVLPSLGLFDAVLFRGEDVGHLEKGHQKKVAGLLVRAGKKLLEGVHKKFGDLKSMRYGDEDVAFFMDKMEKKKPEDQKMVLRFFHDLFKQGQITDKQWEQVCIGLKTRGWATDEDIERMQAGAAKPLPERDHILLLFIEPCLKKHMKSGARLSCYMQDPTSRTEDLIFEEKIIINPAIDYTEILIDDKGIIFTITKP